MCSILAKIVFKGRFRGNETLQKKQYTLTEEKLSSLLALFDDDPQIACEKYELMRSGLERFFQHRGVPCAADLADKTIDVVAEKVFEGEEISPNKVTAFSHGVARNLHKEYLRTLEAKSVGLEDLSLSDHPADRPIQLDPAKEERMLLEEQLKCLDKCLKELPPEQQALIISYYRGEYGEKIGARQEVAKVLALSPGALRTRTHRIRETLEECVTACLKSSAH